MPYLICNRNAILFFQAPAFISGDTQWTDNIKEAELFAEAPEHLVNSILEEYHFPNSSSILTVWIDSTSKTKLPKKKDPFTQ